VPAESKPVIASVQTVASCGVELSNVEVHAKLRPQVCDNRSQIEFSMLFAGEPPK
jgi:hypothetical protein